MVDATASESLIKRTPEETYQLLDDMTLNAFNWQLERSNRKPVEIHSIDTLSSLSVQMKLLSKKMDSLCTFPQYPNDTSYDLSVGNQEVKGQEDPFFRASKLYGKLPMGQNNFQRLAQN